MTRNLALVLAAALSPAAFAAVSLTGLQVISSDASGNSDVQSPQAWNTRNTNGRSKLWVIRGDTDKEFLNGPTHLDAGINIPMTSGTYTYSVFGEPINTVLKPHYALSFFFDLATNPQVTVFTQLNTASTEFFPDWFPVPAKGRTATMDGPTTQSNGTVEFVSGQTTVKVTSFSFSAPSIFKLDRVDRLRNSKGGGLDFIGQFTIEVTAPPEISSGGVVNAASFTPRLAPGSLFTVFGTDLAVAQENASSVPLPKSLGGTSVTVGGREAPLVFVSPTQINAQVPYELAETSSAPVIVKVNGVSSPQRSVQIVKSAPGLFQFGEKRAVVQNTDGTVNTAENPAGPGTFVVAYLTGCGPLDNAVATGGTAAAEPLSRPRGVVTATVAGTGAEVSFGGMTPGFIGLMQVNLKVPALPAGTHPLVVTVDGIQSNAANITVK